MSIWTPSGEHRLGGDSSPSSERGEDRDLAADVPPSAVGAGNTDELSEEDRELAEKMVQEMVEIQRRLVEAPAADVVANHAIGLFELAALHLKQERPNLQAARLSIDAMAAIVETLGERLEGHKATLEQALAQIRLSYVRAVEKASTQRGENASRSDRKVETAEGS